MTKTGKELIMTAVLLGVLALALMNSLNKVKEQNKKAETVEVSEMEEKNGKKEKEEAIKLTEKTVAKAGKEELNKQKERLNIEWGRDPFYAEEQKEENLREVEEKETTEISHFSLKGISWTSERPIALINTQTVTEGESILGYEVIDIQKDKVILRKGDKKYELSIEE